jgi:hypothetical protein
VPGPWFIALALAPSPVPGATPNNVPGGTPEGPRLPPPASLAVIEAEDPEMPALPEASVPTTPGPLKRARKRFRRTRRDNRHRLLPLPHVSSQPATGLTLGGSLNYAYRLPNEDFNRVYALAWSRVSTKLVQDHIISARMRDMLGRKEIFQFGFWASLDPVYPFYGVNNHGVVPPSELNLQYNLVRMDNYGGWFTFEHPLWQLERPGRATGTLRHYSGIFYYVDVVRGYTGSRLLEELPNAEGTTRRGFLRGGLTWDSRDNDWSPHEGALVDLTFDAAGPYTAASTNWGRIHGSMRHYWTLGQTDLVLAHRFTFDSLVGEPPLMALGEFGGLFPIEAYGGAFVGRGYGRRRFIGKHKATAGIELRFAPVELKIRRHTLGLGLELFLELGLVSQKLSDLLKHWYVSGGPGILLIWDRFVVFRVEGGFGKEGGALYLQSEHAF